MALMLEYRVPHTAEAPRVARTMAAQVVEPRLPSQLVEDVVLMVSEAVANAVLHAPPIDGDHIGLRFEADGSALRAVVIDGGPGFGAGGNGADPADLDVHFGLTIIDNLANRWGVSVLEDAKAVWFEIDVPAA